MEFESIFADESEAKLWSVCYEADNGENIFFKLIDDWEGPEFLFNFFSKYEGELANFWKLSVDDAIKKIDTELDFLYEQLSGIESKSPGFEHKKLTSIFQPFHENLTSIKKDEDKFRKSKPLDQDTMLRFYALELEDGSIIISGGCIKVTHKIEEDVLDKERKKLHKLKEYLKLNGIENREGLF